MFMKNKLRYLKVIMNNQSKISTFFTKVSPSGKRSNNEVLEVELNIINLPSLAVDFAQD
jgi:hypothetical protein